WPAHNAAHAQCLANRLNAGSGRGPLTTRPTRSVWRTGLTPVRIRTEGDGMTGMLRSWFRLVVLMAALAMPGSAWAQTGLSGITGVVRDASGAVLPGVTAEAASPALIEQVPSVTAGGDGAYRLVDLRPGAYKVTFTLPGFTTVVREGIDLPASFTATVSV